jgi:hypothetical protein
MRKVDTFLLDRRVVYGLSLVMMGLSWPVWWHVPGLPAFPAWDDARLAGVDQFLLAGCLAGLVLGLTAKAGRLGALVVFVTGVGLILNDQNRLQAWFYQTLLISLASALLPGTAAIGFARFFAIVLYVHSGLSKLDFSFAHQMGPYLLQPVLQFWPKAWGHEWQVYFVLVLPIGEILAALFLTAGRWRVGLAGILLMHGGLLLLLGPWLLGHSGNVLMWNISMACQALVLFYPWRAGEIGEIPKQPHPLAFGVVQLVFMMVAVMPFFERAGLWDAWPSFALYAGHVEQVRLDFPADSALRLPDEFQPFAVRQGDRAFMDLTLWSRRRMGVPPYPAARMQKALARWVAGQCPEEFPIRAIFLSKAHWRTGKRAELVVEGREKIISLK